VSQSAKNRVNDAAAAIRKKRLFTGFGIASDHVGDCPNGALFELHRGMAK
jgi:hypothetical protein